MGRGRLRGRCSIGRLTRQRSQNRIALSKIDDENKERRKKERKEKPEKEQIEGEEQT